MPGLLWIGNAMDARDVKGVLNMGVAAVIDLAIEEPPIQFPREVIYCRFPLLDGEGNRSAILRTAIETVVRLVQDDLPTLVACSGGMSRSPAIAACSLAKINSQAVDQALKMVASTGPCDIAPGLWKSVQSVVDEDEASR